MKIRRACIHLLAHQLIERRLLLLGRAFVEVTGWAHQRVSRAADEVHLAVLGTVVRIKPGWQDGSAVRERS